MIRSKPKIIIWGYPLHSHSHSYIHYAWLKVFRYLGYDSYWFYHENCPTGFDFSNCLFITEGYVDQDIPLDSSSTYFVHMCKNPAKYLEKNCRLIDIRFNVKGTKDFTYDYIMQKDQYVKMDLCTYYEQRANDSALREKYRAGVSGYEAIYTSWATDLLPNEFDERHIYLPRQNTVWYIGTIWTANELEIEEFKRACVDHNIGFISKSPWSEIAEVAEHRQLIQQSYIAPDIRGSGVTCDEATKEECNHLDIGYIPCRTFKNISYGQVGATNSAAVKELFGDLIIYNSSPYNLFIDTVANRENAVLIKEQMQYVKLNHTYINRATNLLKIYHNKI